MKRLATSRRSDESGAVAILVSVMTVMLFIVAAMVVDLGLARDVSRQTQNATDAAALAGANRLYPDSGTCLEVNPWGTKAMPCFADAVRDAKDYAQANYAGIKSSDWASCPASAVPAGFHAMPSGSACISFDTPVAATSEPTKVYVVAPLQTVSTTFGAVAKVDSIKLTKQARATVSASKNYGCALCFLGPVDAENADFTVTGGGIHVNGTSTDCRAAGNTALTTGPNSVWKAETISLCGAVTDKTKATPEPTVTKSFSDPYAGMAQPPASWPAGFKTTGRTDPCKDAANGGGPGIYEDKIELKNDETCTLQPGLYVIRNTWTGKNKSEYVGHGVTLYVEGPNGYLDFKNGSADLSPMSSDPYPGFSIVYDRSNSNMLSLLGNGAVQIKGKVYAPASLLDFNGKSCFTFSGGPIIAKGVRKANGDKACIKVDQAVDTPVHSVPGAISLDQ